MPTNLDRIQCLLQPEPYAQVRTLASHNRRALSGMAAELIEHALKSDKYREQLEAAEIKVPVKEDPRTVVKQRAVTYRYEDMVDDLEEDKLAKLRKILELL